MMTHDQRFDRIDANMERMWAYIQEFRSEAMDRLSVIENRLDGLSATVANIDARFPALTKSMLDAGVFATQQVKLEETVAKLMQPAA